MDTPICSRCGADTQLFVNGTPICIECDQRREKNIIERALAKPLESRKPPMAAVPQVILTAKQ